MTVKKGVPVDIVGNEIKVGSRVISMAKSYRSLVKAKVVSIAPKSILVEYNNTWNYGKEGRMETYRVLFDSVVVIDEKPKKEGPSESVLEMVEKMELWRNMTNS